MLPNSCLSDWHVSWTNVFCLLVFFVFCCVCVFLLFFVVFVVFLGELYPAKPTQIFGSRCSKDFPNDKHWKNNTVGIFSRESSFSWITQVWDFWHFVQNWKQGFNVSAINKVASSGNQTHNTNYQVIRVLIPYPLSQSVIPCQSLIFRPLVSHALLNLEMIQVQKVKWSTKQSSV